MRLSRYRLLVLVSAAVVFPGPLCAADQQVRRNCLGIGAKLSSFAFGKKHQERLVVAIQAGDVQAALDAWNYVRSDGALAYADGRTPLHVAIESKQWAVAQAFVGAQSDKDVKDKKSRTALDAAVEAKAPPYLIQRMRASGFTTTHSFSQKTKPWDQITKEEAAKYVTKLDEALEAAAGLGKKGDWEGAWNTLTRDDLIDGSGFEFFWVAMPPSPDWWWENSSYREERGDVPRDVLLADDMSKVAGMKLFNVEDPRKEFSTLHASAYDSNLLPHENRLIPKGVGSIVFPIVNAPLFGSKDKLGLQKDSVTILTEELLHLKQELQKKAGQTQWVSKFVPSIEKESYFSTYTDLTELDAYAKIHEMYGSENVPAQMRDRYKIRGRFHMKLSPGDELITMDEITEKYGILREDFWKWRDQYEQMRKKDPKLPPLQLFFARDPVFIFAGNQIYVRREVDAMCKLLGKKP